MTSAHDSDRHEEIWLLLPWLASGRLTDAQRERAERHIQSCALCSEGLRFERDLCQALTAPERITYAPGPSFRKLAARIDGTPGHTAPAPPRPRLPVHAKLAVAPIWRPPGLAWAATFVVAVGVTTSLAYHLSAPPTVQAPYRVHADEQVPERNILHIALDPKLTIGDVEQLLQADGARVVEGPGDIGIFGVAPASRGSGPEPDAARKMRALAAKLRADPRVRWVEPLYTGALQER